MQILIWYISRLTFFLLQILQIWYFRIIHRFDWKGSLKPTKDIIHWWWSKYKLSISWDIFIYHETYAPICQRFLSGLFQIQFWDFAIANLITRLNGSDIGAGNNLILVKLFKKATTTMRLFSQDQLFEKPSRGCYWTWGSVFSDVFLKLFLAQTRESLLAVVGIMQK